MSFTKITGLQAKYIEDAKFTVVSDITLQGAKDKNEYYKLSDGYVHLSTVYEDLYDGTNGDQLLSELTRVKKPEKKSCMPRKVKIEPADLKERIERFKQENPNKTLDDLIQYLTEFYDRNMDEYMDIIKSSMTTTI